MAKTIKTQRWWGNVALKVDAEILALDVMEDGLQFRSRREKKRAHEIRAAIAGIECCHFKARHRIERIIHAIKYMVCLVNGSPESVHLNDDWRSRWRSILDYLDSWAGEGRVDLPGTGRVEINGISAKRLDCLLGEKNDAKTRQVRLLAGYLRRRVALWFDTTGSFKKRRDSEHKLDKELQREIEARFDSINIPVGDGTKNLANLLLENFCISNRCFMDDLLSFLAAIGGQVKDVHFKGCGIHPETGKLDLEPLLREVREWLEKSSREINEDEALVNFLGERTPVKQWLVSSLEKTIRAQTIV